MQLGWRRKYPGPRRFCSQRDRAVEHLDRPEVPLQEKRRSYLDLDSLSRLPFQFRPLRNAVLRLAAREAPDASGRPLRLVELGAGTGAVGLRLSRCLARRGYAVDFHPTDISTPFLPAPSAGGGLVVVPGKLDALRDPIPRADIIVATLLIHHFDAGGARRLLEGMSGAARLGGAVFDLDRNPWAFAFLRCFLPLWARSPITVADGLLSVQQAFRPQELAALAREAGIPSPRVKTYLGLRTLLWWEASL